MNKLRIWLAYYIMPKDTRKHLIKALSYSIEELEREIAELFDQMNAEPQERSLIPDTRPTFEEAADAISKGLTMYETHKADKEGD